MTRSLERALLVLLVLVAAHFAEAAQQRRDPREFIDHPAVAPRALFAPAATLTPAQKLSRVSGVVLLRVGIDREGRVVGGRALRTPPPYLAESAIAAVRLWRFRPAEDGHGHPVACFLNVAVPFSGW